MRYKSTIFSIAMPGFDDRGSARWCHIIFSYDIYSFDGE